MLNALKQLIGLAPREIHEDWLDVPVIIVDTEGNELFAGECTVVYYPSPEAYEHGSAKLFDSVTGAEIMAFTVLHAEKLVGAPSPQYWARYDATGATMEAVDATGRQVTILVRQSASTYVLDSEGLLSQPNVGPMVMVEPGAELVEEALFEDGPMDEDLF